MRSSATVALAVLAGLASAQIEIPDDLDINSIINNLPSGVDVNSLVDSIPTGVDVNSLVDSLPTGAASSILGNLPSGVDASSLVANLPTGVAQSTTASAPSTSSTAGADSDTVAGLVNQLPRCAVTCLDSASESIGCSPTDFACLCKNSDELIASIGPCVLFSSSCASGDAEKAAEVAPKICTKVNQNPAAADLASASAIVGGAVASSTSGSGSSNDDESGGAASASYGMGLFGTLAMMVLAF